MEEFQEKLAAAKKEVLVDIVKLVQKQGMQGYKGGWKDFLSVYDKFGASVSDPKRRSLETLLDFLKTFTKAADLKCFEKVIVSHSHRESVDPDQKKIKNAPAQRLLSLTVGHPEYPFNYSFPSHEDGWVTIDKVKKSKTASNALLAVDCEMVLCEDGTDALVKVCVVDHRFMVQLDQLVNPDKAVRDYRTEITGISSKDLEGVTCSLQDIQESMKKLLSKGSILVGHSLNNDLQALKIDYARVIDTSLIYKYWNGSKFRKPSLNHLCKSVLGYELRLEGATHNCLDDARAAMRLVLAKINGGIHSSVTEVKGDVSLKRDEVHDSVTEIKNDISVADMTKLLIHRIPVSLPAEMLHKILPGDFTIELKENKKSGDTYSAFAVFKTQQEANQAFEGLDNKEEKDSSGRSQKPISFKLNTGLSHSIYVRKMDRDIQLDQSTSRKRAFYEALMCKKLRTDQTPGEAEEVKAGIEICSNHCVSHLEEIERLKHELSEKDQEISTLQKIVIASTRKQLGL